jgi:hypothetical protein
MPVHFGVAADRADPCIDQTQNPTDTRSAIASMARNGPGLLVKQIDEKHAQANQYLSGSAPVQLSVPSDPPASCCDERQAAAMIGQHERRPSESRATG